MKTKTLIISLLLAATAAAQNARVAVTKDPATGALSNSFTVPSGITVTVASGGRLVLDIGAELAGLVAVPFAGLAMHDEDDPHSTIIELRNANTADRLLAIDMNDGARTLNLLGDLTVAANASVAGTNTGDQTITLTGAVTGSGTGTITTTLVNTAVTPGSYTNANITVGADGRITSASNGTGGGANPAGSGTELQFRASASALGALTGSSVSGANLSLGGTLSTTATTNNGVDGAIWLAGDTVPSIWRRRDINMVTFGSGSAGGGTNSGSTGISTGSFAGLNLGSNAFVSWTNDTPASSVDTRLRRVSSGHLMQAQGVTAQAFSVARTYSSTTSYEAVTIDWLSELARIRPTKGSTGGGSRSMEYWLNEAGSNYVGSFGSQLLLRTNSNTLRTILSTSGSVQSGWDTHFNSTTRTISLRGVQTNFLETEVAIAAQAGSLPGLRVRGQPYYLPAAYGSVTTGEGQEGVWNLGSPPPANGTVVWLSDWLLGEPEGSFPGENPYYIRDVSGNTFKLADEPGGPALEGSGGEEWSISATMSPPPLEAHTKVAFFGANPTMRREDRYTLDATEIGPSNSHEFLKPLIEYLHRLGLVIDTNQPSAD